MRFLGDMGVSIRTAIRIVEWLRGQGHDAIHVRELGMGQSLDSAILARARSESRVVLTFDLDFGDLLAAWDAQPSPVILFRLRNTRIENVISRLDAVLKASATVLAEPCVVIVEDSRHRVRVLD